MKVSNADEQSYQEITRNLSDLEHTMTEIDNNITIERTKFEENQKNKAQLEGNIYLGKTRIESTKTSIEDLNEQIKKLNQEMTKIRNCKSKINEDFEEKKDELILKIKEKLKVELEQKTILNAKVNEEQQKVMANLKQMVAIREQKVNYIIIIDRSGSMYQQIQQVNAAAQNFLTDLKKTNNNNFFFSVVYFESSSTITADTLPLSSTSNFAQYLSQPSAGGTSYCQGLANVYNILSRNIRSGIERVSMVFFTDGGDGDDYEDTYNQAINIKTTYGSNAMIYIRGLGLGNFSQSSQTHLKKIASIINSGCNSNISLQEVDVVDNLSQIVQFFVSISSSYVDYYDEINKKVQSLERLRDTLHKEEMNLRKQHYMAQDFELLRLEERKNADLSKAAEKEKLLASYNNQLKDMKTLLDSYFEQCTNLEKQIKEDQQKLEVVNKFQNINRITELVGKLMGTQKKIDKESITVQQAMSLRKTKLYEIISKKSKELGFPGVDTFDKFKEELDKFQFRFQEFSSISKKYQTRMENYSTQMQTHVTQFKNEITSEKSQQLRNLLYERKLQMLLAKDPSQPNPNVSNILLFELLEKEISIIEKNFGLQELMEVCNDENAIVDIICEIDPDGARIATKAYIKQFLSDILQNQKFLENKISKLEAKGFEEDEDKEFQRLKKEEEKLKEEIELGKREGEPEEEWVTRRQILKEKINLKSTEMNNRRKELKEEKLEMEKFSDEKEKFDEKKLIIEARYSNALTNVLIRLRTWLSYYDATVKGRTYIPALEYLNEQLLMLQGGNLWINFMCKQELLS